MDMNFVNQYAGPRPAAPVQQPVSRLGQLGAILSGVSAGLQGRGGEFAASLRAERERPMREYQQQLRDFEERRTRGLELATRRQEQQQERDTRAAEITANREFQQWAQRAKITDELALQQARQAFETQKLREQERIRDEQIATQQKALDERQARGIESELISKDGAPPTIAKEISQYLISGRPLSPAAEKWRGAQAQKIAAQIARLSRMGGSGGGAEDAAMQKAIERFEGVKQQYADAVARGDAKGQQQLQKKMTAAHNALTRFPGLELGYDPTGKWPYQKPRGQQTSGSPEPPLAQFGVPSPAFSGLPPGIGAPTGPLGLVPASTSGAPQISRAQAKGKLVKEGFSSKEADAELDRLGIK
jgi:hypothetical protein